MNSNHALGWRHKRVLLLLTLLFSFCARVHAGEHGYCDLNRLVRANQQPARGASLDMGFLDVILADLRQHARNYPPSFDSDADAQRAQRDASTLIGMLGALFADVPARNDLLLRMGILGAVGHNMDLPTGAKFAQTNFNLLLKADTDHAAGNLHYGTFMSGSGHPQDALPYLMRAKASGVVPALYAIGMTYLSLGDSSKALENLRAYQIAEPRDTAVSKIIGAVQTGRFKLNQSGAP